MGGCARGEFFAGSVVDGLVRRARRRRLAARAKGSRGEALLAIWIGTVSFLVILCSCERHLGGCLAMNLVGKRMVHISQDTNGRRRFRPKANKPSPRKFGWPVSLLLTYWGFTLQFPRALGPRRSPACFGPAARCNDVATRTASTATVAAAATAESGDVAAPFPNLCVPSLFGMTVCVGCGAACAGALGFHVVSGLVVLCGAAGGLVCCAGCGADVTGEGHSELGMG